MGACHTGNARRSCKVCSDRRCTYTNTASLPLIPLPNQRYFLIVVCAARLLSLPPLPLHDFVDKRQHQHQAKHMMVRAIRVRSNTFTEFSIARPSAKDDAGASVQRKGAKAAPKVSVAMPQSSLSLNVQPTSSLMVPASGQ